MTRNSSLDALRALAVLLVIGDHVPYFKFMNAGWIGVDLFFVLSGFLISGLLFSDLLANGRIAIGRFLVRRGLKIYPPLIVFLGLTSIFSADLRHHLWVQTFFLQSYFVPKQAIWQHTWSLGVEEHFYLSLPLLLVWLNRTKRIEVIPYIAVALIVLCFVLRLRVTTVVALSQTHLRVDSLFAGVTLGWLYHLHRQRFLSFSRWWTSLLALVILFCVVGLIVSTSNSNFRASSLITLNLVGFSFLVLWAVPRTLPVPALLGDIGRYSYSIYIWHMLMAVLFGQEHVASAGAVLACVLLSVCIGVAMSTMVEMPVLCLRDKFFPSRSSFHKPEDYEAAVKMGTTSIAAGANTVGNA